MSHVDDDFGFNIYIIYIITSLRVGYQIVKGLAAKLINVR